MESDGLIPYGRLTNTTLKAGNYAMLEVSDTGCGMSRDVMNKIFDPFFTTKFTGRGLGLSAVLGIIKGHRGGLTVESKEGNGTIFRVIIPTCTPLEPDNVLPTQSNNPELAALTTVLIIDDDANIASIAGEIIEAEQYKTLIELNPIRAIELYKQYRSEIGLVLLDLTMPEMSGKEVVQALKAIDSDIKIIISSGYSEYEMHKEIGVEKVSGFIEKPYRMQSLLAVIHSVMQQSI